MGNENGGTSLQTGLTSPEPLVPLVVSTSDTVREASPQLSPTASVAIENALLSSISPEHIGLPNDGKWDVTAAHESRFCF